MPAKKSPKSDPTAHERAIWRGSISFGLVQIPVGLYRADSDSDLHFTMLDKKDHAPVRFERKNGQTGKPLQWGDIVKGYEYERGSFIIMTDEDFAKANVAATGGIDITDFVDADEVDPLYYSKPYYLLPQGKGEKTYVLLRESLRKANKVGVSKIVIRTRQHLALVRVYGDALVLELLRFPHELRPIDELKFPPRGLKAAGVNEREVAMATSLIESMQGSWDPKTYKDDYHDDLLALIKRKQRTGKKTIVPAEKKPVERTSKVVDIMELLQRSVADKAKSKKKISDPGKASTKPKKTAKASTKSKTAPRKAKARATSKPSRPRSRVG